MHLQNHPTLSAAKDCPCGSGVSYAECCQPYLSGEIAAPTAEALMRSRYSAYVKGNIDYLIATLHPKSRQKDDRRILRLSIQTSRWLGLTILKTQKGQATDSTGKVEFVARYQSTQPQPAATPGLPTIAPIEQLHERSKFVKQDGQWFYIDGEMLPPVRL
jgi:SEC-C motif domain protein